MRKELLEDLRVNKIVNKLGTIANCVRLRNHCIYPKYFLLCVKKTLKVEIIDNTQWVWLYIGRLTIQNSVQKDK